MLVRPILLFPLWFFLKAPIYRDRHNNLPLNATKTMDYSDQYNLIVTFILAVITHPLFLVRGCSLEWLPTVHMFIV